MITKRIAVDANLLLLLVVGSVAPEFIPRHKRLKAYVEADFELLSNLVVRPDRIVATPTTLAEVSNLIGFGVAEPYRSNFARALKNIIDLLDERYQPSRNIVHEPEFIRLGLSDCAWLGCLDADTELITADLPLYLIAVSRGLNARNFTHLRDVARQS